VGELAYGVAPQYRRRGLATRAVRLVTAWAFAHLGLARLEIVVTAGGVHGRASQCVAENAGFVAAGMRRSHIPATGRDYEDPLYVLPAPRPDV
jgi:RimJ/RimL family protein N-acetyltransferase